MAKKYVENADTRPYVGSKGLRIATGALIVALSGGYVLSSFGGEIKGYVQDQMYRHGLYKVEEQSDDSSYLVTMILPEETDNSSVIEEEPEEIIEEEEEVIIYPEATSSELLDLGYEFKDVNFNELQAINPEVNAYFTIDNTRIDYPVAQRNIDAIHAPGEEIAEANNYYLHHDMYGNNNDNGTLCIDSRINLELGDTSETMQYSPIVIYGHHMRTGAMFTDIDQFQRVDYAESHPFGMLYTESGAYKVEFYAGRILNPDGNGVLDETEFYSQDLDNEEVFYDYVNNQKMNSTFESDINPEYGDKLFVAITCNYTTGNSRYALYGRLVRQYTNEQEKEAGLINEQGYSLKLSH